MIRVAIQGQPASFHDVAARQFFGDELELVCCDLPFSKVFDALEQGKADFAVCAIENSLYGAIPEVYDLLLRRRPWMCGEVVLHIQQCLIGLPGADVSAIQAVYSHPVALAQCQPYIDTTLSAAAQFAVDDTAGSVQQVAEWQDMHKAAIASEAAAQHYGLTVLAKGIEADHQNYTRFAVLEPRRSRVVAATKSSLVITTNHQPGALHRMLGAFAAQDCNLSLLVSRPIIGQPGRYTFYVDVEQPLDAPGMQQAIAAVKAQGCTIAVLGTYDAAVVEVSA